MELFEMGMMQKFMQLLVADSFGLSGHIVLQAWERGAIPHLMAQGLSLEEVKAQLTPLAIVESRNIFVTVGKTAILDALIDAAVQWDTGITYCAIGTGSTTPAIGDTTLTTEAARKACTTRTRSGTTNTYSTFFTAAQSGYAIEEVGLFGTSTAGASANSGVLFAHGLLSYNNSGGSPVDLTIDYTITCS